METNYVKHNSEASLQQLTAKLAEKEKSMRDEIEQLRVRLDEETRANVESSAFLHGEIARLKEVRSPEPKKKRFTVFQ
ncbi:unnamed protein product [Protopolystoma xenopodis]|uniref:Uncharacterized protein n=1 Tax=Protopolystoma xenopodis TaxID=117903 RepID=A0A448X8E1_9PLAT|nr:unnamed protein product [Protopolystoma xenopodis]